MVDISIASAPTCTGMMQFAIRVYVQSLEASRERTKGDLYLDDLLVEHVMIDLYLHIFVSLIGVVVYVGEYQLVHHLLLATAPFGHEIVILLKRACFA